MNADANNALFAKSALFAKNLRRDGEGVWNGIVDNRLRRKESFLLEGDQIVPEVGKMHA